MRRARTALTALTVVAAVVAVQGHSAVSACSCATDLPRTPQRLELDGYDVVVQGRIVDGSLSRPVGIMSSSPSITLAVQQVLKGEVPDRIEVRDERGTCGGGPARDGWWWLRREGDDLVLPGTCGGPSLEALLASSGAPPPVDGHGPVRALVGIELGDLTMAALDGDGKVLGYGMSGVPPTAWSVCPGSRRAVAGAVARPAWGPPPPGAVDTVDTIDTIDLATLTVVANRQLPARSQRVDHVWCRDADAHDVVGVSSVSNAPPGATAPVSTTTTVTSWSAAAVTGEVVAPGRLLRSGPGDGIVVADGPRLTVVRVRPDAPLRTQVDLSAELADAHGVALAPDGRQLAVVGCSVGSPGLELGGCASTTAAPDRIVRVDLDRGAAVASTTAAPFWSWPSPALDWDGDLVRLRWIDKGAGWEQAIGPDGVLPVAVRLPDGDRGGLPLVGEKAVERTGFLAAGVSARAVDGLGRIGDGTARVTATVAVPDGPSVAASTAHPVRADLPRLAGRITGIVLVSSPTRTRVGAVALVLAVGAVAATLRRRRVRSRAG